MADGLFNWHPQNYTVEENSRWVWLRANEWDSYPTFLAPLWGIFFVYFYGWLSFIVTLIVVTFIWKLFIVKNFVSIGLLSSMAVIINTLKWPLAVVFGIVSYLTYHNLIFSASVLFFPAITYCLTFLELPYRMGGIMKQGKHQEQIQKRIMHKLGITVEHAEDMPNKGQHPFLF
jgi:hypothetical protein